ncbi:pentapeptide repeat-containing protein [Amycolatopsis thailandensis]|uniref:pentapeptide repeat-containing protein n=1 Tax=Amycolatopsis thailandensis TaxID=589330 RepID=UPI00363FAA51
MRRLLRSPLLWTLLSSVAVLVGVTAWLLTDRATSRGDALKTGALAGGAIAALYGLWLNDRRRRTEEDRHEIERSRISDERFAKSIELLGNDADQVRVGAMHSLAGLARTRPEYRQTVLDVLCAYLRRPFEHPKFDPDADWGDGERKAAAERERLVRRAAERLIRDILPHSGTTGPTFSLNLSDARLDKLGLLGRRVGWFGADRCEVLTYLDLTDTQLSGKFLLENVTIHGEFVLTRASFERKVSLDNTVVETAVDFSEATFAEPPSLEGATFAAGSTLPVASGEDGY